jgi:hypothetical protein
MKLFFFTHPAIPAFYFILHLARSHNLFLFLPGFFFVLLAAAAACYSALVVEREMLVAAAAAVYRGFSFLF